MHFRSLFTACALLPLCLAALLAGPAAAHPSDEALVYHYLWLEAKPGQLSLQQATTVGGLLTQTVWPEIDRDGSGEPSEAEQEAHARGLAAGLSLTIDGKPVPWELASYEYPSKEAFFGGSFAVVKLLLRAPLPKTGKLGHTVEVRDETYPHFKALFPQPVIRPSRLSAGEPSVSPDGRVFTVRLFPEG
ncbi:MAG TPA: hypothetical protein VFU47_08585, partial [Armatimonadota bacterium]|nr:hypothetical protein [Armatimonadota bacterium]